MADDDTEQNYKQMASSKQGVYRQQPTSASEVASDARHPQQQAPIRPSRTRHHVSRKECAVPTSGVVALPAGSRGPRSLYLRREGDSFGFTLRHFIVYPPDSITSGSDGRHAAVGALRQPMESIFVRHVSERSAAERAGLHHGDRLVAVNGTSCSGQPYATVVHLIQTSPPYLHLLVVPKEDDVLQKFFPETAHNPETNQRPSRFSSPESFDPRRQHQQQQKQNNELLKYRPIVYPAAAQQSSSRPRAADTVSWRSYEEPSYSSVEHRNSAVYQPLPHPRASRDTKSSEQLYRELKNSEQLYRDPRNIEQLYRDPRSAEQLYRDPRSAEQLYRDPRSAEQLYREPRSAEQLYREPSGGEQLYSVPKDSLVYRPIQNQRQLEGNRQSLTFESVYSEPYVHDECQRPRAQPQVPPHYRKMGRRASEGSNVSEHSRQLSYDTSEYPDSDMVVNSTKMKSASKVADSLDAGRRESTVSLNSSLADGSKDSLSSFDSTSTLTGQDTDDSIIMTRFRKSFEKKEEFLRRPSAPIGWKTPEDNNKLMPTVIQREFYGRPQKLQKEWPPNEPSLNGQESPVKNSAKPTHQNLHRVKVDIDSERDYLAPLNGKDSVRNDIQMARNKFYESAIGQPAQFMVGGPVSNSPLQRNSNIRQSKDKNSFVTTLSRIHESAVSTAENGDDSVFLNGTASLPTAAMHEHMNSDERRYPVPPNLQIVSRRTRQFESGRPLPEDEDGGGSLSDRTNFYRSELSRLSSKRVVPNVAVRKREFETLEIENNKDFRRDRDMNRRPQRESRSLDHSGKDTNTTMENKTTISGNRVIPIGSKYLHCIPPSDYKATDMPFDSDMCPVQMRARSNSAESWSAAMQNSNSNRNILEWQQHTAAMADDKHRNKVVRQDSYISALKSKVPVPGDVPPQVVRRSKNNTNSIGDEDRATRRVSYLKATWGERMHLESDLDLSDTEVSPQVLRSRSGSTEGSGPLSLGRSETPTTPDRESAPVTREGALSCKFMELEGKRANDRSWHKVWAVLKGPQLLLYKDRHHHHQSPMGLVDTDQQLPGGVDMRYSVVNVADDYTKRKNVLRISGFRTELLLQADSPVEMADWIRTLQEQTGASTDEEKQECMSENKQAVPQQVPAATSVQVQGTARLSPQPTNKSKLSTFRNRSPTGQSPKSKTWRGRVVKQFKKLNQGSGSPSSPTTPEKLTFGVPLENCQRSIQSEFVPRFVEMCTEIIEERGLEVIGIYRVPGNNAAVSALTEELNKGVNLALHEVRASDTNVVSSLLKSFFRKLPDSLLTSELYPQFIEADKIEDPKLRLGEIKKLLIELPAHQYETLKHLILHLKKVVDNCEVNKMEARNLAIVFGPTLVRNVEDNMVTMVTDMSHQCRIVESLLLYAEWFFSEDESEALNINSNIAHDVASIEMDNTSATVNNTLLLSNISKIEGIKTESANSKKDIVSSIISAANRKIQRKSRKTTADNSNNSKEEATTPTSESKDTCIVALPTQAHEIKQPSLDSEESSSSCDNVMPEQPQHLLLMTYPQINAKTSERVEKFKQETMAMLQQPKRRSDISRSYSKPHLQNGSQADSTDSQTSSDFLATITSVLDDKLKALQSPTNCLTVAENIPYADESPDVTVNSFDTTIVEGAQIFQESPKCDQIDKMSPKSFRNPSLHKSYNSSVSSLSHKLNTELKHSHKTYSDQKEKDVDEHEIAETKLSADNNHRNTDKLNELCKINFNTFIEDKELKCSTSDSKLKRSESLNKSDNRDNEQEHGKLKRSVSLNRAADRLKRSDSLTKYEKTESNINLRRELADDSNRRLKKVPTKLKRKNGMPERSIKRRHTVGGTKDFDRVHWLDNRLRYEAEESNEDKEKVALRSSSPDLSCGDTIITNLSDENKLPLESHI